MGIGGFGAMIPMIKAGNLKGLVITSVKRSSVFPQIPTMAEKGFPEACLNVRNGLVVPQRTPKPVVDKLEKAMMK